MRSMIQDVRNRWSWYPTMATYQGGHSNRLDGAFAGLTDIQGMDMYVAACAPHIQDFLHPVRYFFSISSQNHVWQREKEDGKDAIGEM